MLGEGDRVLETRYIARLCVWGGRDGRTKRGSASEVFIPKQEETRRRDTLVWSKKSLADEPPRLRSLVWSCEAPETTWHYESYMNI